jgi:hypothetical protein
MFLALAITLRVLGFDFVAHLLIMLQCRLIGQPARYWSRLTSEGQFPFPLAPEFWGSWTDSWLETNLPRTMPTSSEVALASNLFDVSSHPKRREIVIINHSLALPLSGSLNFFLNLLTLRPFYPQPASWYRLVSLGPAAKCRPRVGARHGVRSSTSFYRAPDSC